jgi:hypothetical protein
LVDAKQFANQDSASGNKDRSGKQVSVHSVYKYHKNILADVVQALSSVDRDQIKNRERIDSEHASGETWNNHYRLVNENE